MTGFDKDADCIDFKKMKLRERGSVILSMSKSVDYDEKLLDWIEVMLKKIVEEAFIDGARAVCAHEFVFTGLDHEYGRCHKCGVDSKFLGKY